MPLTLLLCSNDVTLSLTRELLLRKTGYRVTTVLHAADAINLLMHQHFDGVVLCQTLAPQECEAIMAAADDLPSPVKTIVVTDIYIGLRKIANATAIAPPLQSPQALLRLIQDTFV